MALYLLGLLLITAGIELTLALVLASQGRVASPSSIFWAIYLIVDIAMFSGGGLLIPRGLSRLRVTGRRPTY
jgi:hypothetical protein